MKENNDQHNAERTDRQIDEREGASKQASTQASKQASKSTTNVLVPVSVIMEGVVALIGELRSDVLKGPSCRDHKRIQNHVGGHDKR